MAHTNKLGKLATTIRTERGDIVVKYHSTDVVRFNTTHITLCSGGWNTVSTANRMTQAARQFDLPYSVSLRGGKRAGNVRNNILAKSKNPNGAKLWVTYGNGIVVTLPDDRPYTFERVSPLPETTIDAMATT